MKNKRAILIILLFVGLSGGLKTEARFQTKYAITRNGEFVNFMKKKYFDCIPTIGYIPVRVELKYHERQSGAASLPDEALNAANLSFPAYPRVSKEKNKIDLPIHDDGIFFSRKEIINAKLKFGFTPGLGI